MGWDVYEMVSTEQANKVFLMEAARRLIMDDGGALHYSWLCPQKDFLTALLALTFFSPDGVLQMSFFGGKYAQMRIPNRKSAERSFMFFVCSTIWFDSAGDTPAPLCDAPVHLSSFRGDLSWGSFPTLPGASYQPEQNGGLANIPSIHRHCLWSVPCKVRAHMPRGQR